MKYFVLVVLLCGILDCDVLAKEAGDSGLLGGDGQETYSIIVGKPHKVKDSPNELVTDRVMIASLYVVQLKDYKVIAGDHKERRTLKVEIQASSGGVILAHPEIYVVVKDSDEKVLDGGDRWGKPMYAVCLPVDEVEQYDLGDQFGSLVTVTGKRCRGAYGD